MSKFHAPHDKLFKSAMADIRVARDFFKREISNILEPTMEMIQRLIHEENFSHYIFLILKYIIVAGNTERAKDLIDTIFQRLPRSIGDEFMATAAQYLKKEGSKDIFFLLAKEKFGELPIKYSKIIEQGSQEQLMKWALKIMKVSSLTALFEEEAVVEI